jgi:hypothetical protein
MSRMSPVHRDTTLITVMNIGEWTFHYRKLQSYDSDVSNTKFRKQGHSTGSD